MDLNIIKQLYSHVRNTLIWIVVYFVVQAVIWATLAVLILLYPRTLDVLAVVFLFILTVVSLYFAIMIGRVLMKVKEIKDLVSGKFVK